MVSEDRIRYIAISDLVEPQSEVFKYYMTRPTYTEALADKQKWQTWAGRPYKIWLVINGKYAWELACLKN